MYKRSQYTIMYTHIQVVIGDQLTCKNVRAMKEWIQTEIQAKDRLQWAHEVPGKFMIL